MGAGARVSWRRVASHLAVGAAGVLASTFVAAKSLESASSTGTFWERHPFERAAWFAYVWGNESDASLLLGKYAAKLRSAPSAEGAGGPEDIALAEFRRALVERRPRSELAELCRDTPSCNPARLDALTAKLAQARRVADVR
jgi:hypothetical protein